MSQAFSQHLTKYLKLSEEDLNNILGYFTHAQFKKKENLLTEGKTCDNIFFVEKGLLRLFFINDKGIEQTTHFAMENWWMADYASFESKKPSSFNIQAVEKTDVLCLSYLQQEALLQAYPQLERYFRLIHQRAHAASQFRIRWLYDLSREEMYHNFVNRYPEFVQRIPQYLLASFLGFTPEYLSEIRGRKKS